MSSMSWRFFAFHGEKRFLAKCGHLTAHCGRVRAFGCETITTMRPHDGDVFPYCLECVEAMAIPCSWCGRTIFIGDPITLYTTTDRRGRHEMPLFYREDANAVVGCLRMNCADSGADRAGFWVPNKNGKGMVERIPTVFEHIIRSNSEAAIVRDVREREISSLF